MISSRAALHCGVIVGLVLAAALGCSSEDPVSQNAPANETVSRPDPPSLAAETLVDSIVTLVSGGAESDLGHPVEYRFNLDDGRLTPWSSNPVTTASWSLDRMYYVRAQARCAQHADVVSEWTGPRGIDAIAEVVSSPVLPAGANVLCPGSATSFEVGGAASSVGHPVEYQVDWGDETSEWIPAGSYEHEWTTLGSYACGVRARCTLDPTIISPWSPVNTVSIESPASPWALEVDLPDLIGSYSHNTSGNKSVRIPYDGPRARIVRYQLAITGKAAGTTCQLDDKYNDPTVHELTLYVYTALGIYDKPGGHEAWPPMTFSGLQFRDFDTGGVWWLEGNDWSKPIVIDPGDDLVVWIRSQLEDYICTNSYWCYVYTASLIVEFDCAP